MTNNDIPIWLNSKNEYIAPKKGDKFLSKNLVSFFSVLKKIKSSVDSDFGHSSFKMVYLFITILLTALSKNIYFTLFLGAIILIATAFLSAKKEKRLFSSVFTATLISAIILLPSVFLGSPRSLITVTLKVAVTVGAISLFSETTSPLSLTSALKSFHIPDLIIHLFEWTFKYIFILSQTCTEMLIALKTRLIGKKVNGSKSYSGILSVCFIKSKAMSEECSSAMECRGFDGHYRKRKQKLTWRDCIITLMFLAIATLFVYLEIVL